MDKTMSVKSIIDLVETAIEKIGEPTVDHEGILSTTLPLQRVEREATLYGLLSEDDIIDLNSDARCCSRRVVMYDPVTDSYREVRFHVADGVLKADGEEHTGSRGGLLVRKANLTIPEDFSRLRAFVPGYEDDGPDLSVRKGLAISVIQYFTGNSGVYVLRDLQQSRESISFSAEVDIGIEDTNMYATSQCHPYPVLMGSCTNSWGGP